VLSSGLTSLRNGRPGATILTKMISLAWQANAYYLVYYQIAAHAAAALPQNHNWTLVKLQS